MENKYLNNWTAQLKKGVLPYLVLKILNEEKKYGYELLKRIDSVLESKTTDGTLYPMLIKMYEEDLLKYEWVEQASGIPRKYYTVTPKGKLMFAEMEVHLNKTFTQIK